MIERRTWEVKQGPCWHRLVLIVFFPRSWTNEDCFAYASRMNLYGSLLRDGDELRYEVWETLCPD